MWNASDPLPHSLRSDVVYHVDCKGCKRTTSAKPERPYKAEYVNIKEQSGEERPPLSSRCTQLKLVTALTLKTPRLLTTAASKGNAW